jgi:hypothetical protein
MPWLVESGHLISWRNSAEIVPKERQRFQVLGAKYDHRVSMAISKVKRFQELSYEEWPERESNPDTRIFTSSKRRIRDYTGLSRCGCGTYTTVCCPQ